MCIFPPPRSLKNDGVNEGNTLEIESCFSSDHLPDKSKMPDLIKKVSKSKKNAK